MDALSYIISVPLRLISIAISFPIVLIGKIYDLFFKKYPKEPHTILITGASSGICKEVAIQYAKPGVTLILIARNEDRLNAVADTVREKGASVVTASIDICNTSAIKEFILKQDDIKPIDLVIAGVGLVTPSDNEKYTLDSLYDYIITSNFNTCTNTVLPLLDRFRQRRYGQICILSSIAGLGMNFVSPMYSSTKMMLYAFGEALRVMLSPYGVFVSNVCPGYTDTPILDTHSGKTVQWKLSASHVASLIISGLSNDLAVIECNMVYNLVVAMFVRHMPKLARDYLFQILIPVAKRHNMFVNEYPSLEDIYREDRA